MAACHPSIAYNPATPSQLFQHTIFNDTSQSQDRHGVYLDTRGRCWHDSHSTINRFCNSVQSERYPVIPIERSQVCQRDSPKSSVCRLLCHNLQRDLGCLCRNIRLILRRQDLRALPILGSTFVVLVSIICI